MKFCTYITFYRGNKLPPFYFGSTSISNIKKGYRGSASSQEYVNLWKYESKINPHLFKTYIISTHNSRGEAYEKETKLLTAVNASQNSLYLNASNKARFPEMTPEIRHKLSLIRKGKSNPEHSRKMLDYYSKHPKQGTPRSEESRRKMSVAKKGKPAPNKGIPHSDLAKQKMSNIRKLKQIGLQPINQYTSDLVFVKQWKSVKEAAEYYSKHSATLIQNAKEHLTHPHRKAAGFKWRYP